MIYIENWLKRFIDDGYMTYLYHCTLHFSTIEGRVHPMYVVFLHISSNAPEGFCVLMAVPVKIIWEKLKSTYI